MKINIQNLKDGQHFFEFEKSSAELGIEDTDMFASTIRVESNVDKRKSAVVVFSKAKTKANYVCDRCLTQFSEPVNEKFTIFFTTDQTYLDSEDNEQVQLIGAHTREIDLGSGVRESILLAVPMKHVCSKDCKGLCPSCGINLNKNSCRCVHETVDPRWEVLKKLVS
jgi:uncharacterized protein